MQLSSLLVVTGASLAAAHYKLTYPEWRADTLGSEEFSQWTYPCAGVPANAGNRTEWPLDGGSLVLGLNHAWTYLFVNLGMGSNASSFNISLTEPFWNATGNGTLCVPKITLPTDLDIKDGDEASLQVVTLGEKGQSLYNCADIKFSSAAKVLEGDACKSVNITAAPIVVADEADAAGNESESDDGSGSDAGGTSAAGAVNANVLATSGFAALVVAVVYGAGL